MLEESKAMAANDPFEFKIVKCEQGGFVALNSMGVPVAAKSTGPEMRQWFSENMRNHFDVEAEAPPAPTHDMKAIEVIASSMANVMASRLDALTAAARQQQPPRVPPGYTHPGLGGNAPPDEAPAQMNGEHRHDDELPKVVRDQDSTEQLTARLANVMPNHRRSNMVAFLAFMAGYMAWRVASMSGLA